MKYNIQICQFTVACSMYSHLQTTEQALASHESRMTCARASWKEWFVLNNSVVPQWVEHGVIPVNTVPLTLTVKKATLRTSIVGSVLVSQQS